MRHLLVIFLFCFQFSTVKANPNIVYLDVQFIIDNSDLGIFYKNKVNKIKDEKKIELSIKEKKIKEKEEDINNKKNILKEEELKKNISELKNLVNEYKVVRNDVSKFLINEKKKYSEVILENLNPILTNYADKNNINLILEKKNILVGAKVLDITQNILNLLNEDTKKKNLINEN